MKSKNTDHQPTSALGLDVGTSRIAIAAKDGDEFVFRSRRNAFVAVPFSKMTERMLARERVPHVTRNGDILVYGDESEPFADLFHLETRRPMSRGVLNPDEPDGPLLIRTLIEALAGDDDRRRTRLCFSVPAPALDGDGAITFHEAALRQLLEELGYDAMSINEGLAVIYSELDRSNYTGLGVSFGGGLCNVCLAYLSAPLFSFSVSKAGDFIDCAAAAVSGELATRVRITKEQSFAFNGNFADKMRQAIGVYYNEMIQAVVAGLETAFSNSLNVPKIGRPIPVVLSGGSALPAGFRDRFEKKLRETELPVPISEVILAADPLNATAKGALVAALCDIG
jgi:hypothetical protein